MPTNPRDRMAELLRAVARKRNEQAGAPFDLHPATRSMLQAEVARLAPRLRKSRRRAAFFPRFVFAAAAAASIALCAVILFRNEPPAPTHALLAKNMQSHDVLTNVHGERAILLAGGEGGGNLTLSPGDALMAPAPSPSVAIRLNHSTLVAILPPEDEKAGEELDESNGGLVSFQAMARTADRPSFAGITINSPDEAAPAIVTNSLNGANLTINGSNNLRGNETVMFAEPLPMVSYAGTFTLDAISKDLSGEDTAAGPQLLKNKLDQIILPSVDFHDATLSEAISTLRKESADYDTSDTDRAHKGVNIVLYQPGLATSDTEYRRAGAGGGQGAVTLSGSAKSLEPPPGGPTNAPAPAQPASAAVAAPSALQEPANPSARITLSLKNVALSEALRHVASLSGMRIQVDASTVNVVPPGVADEVLVTKEYAVPTSFLGGAFAAAAEADHNKMEQSQKPPAPAADKGGQLVKGAAASLSTPPKITALDYLKDAGVQFPPGASADYVPADGKLVVRNTGGNLDLVDKIVDASINAELARETVAARKLAIERTIEIVAGKTPAPDVVLATFQLQVEGDVIYIVDSDGSIYSGKIEQPLLEKMLASNGRTFTNLAAARQAKRDAAGDESRKKLQTQSRFQYQGQGAIVTAGASNSTVATGVMGGSEYANADQKQAEVRAREQQQNFSFRATGINRKLRTPVIVEGNYISATVEQTAPAQEQLATQNGENDQGANFKNAAAGEKQKEAAKAISVENNARIEGQAQVGDNGTVEIDAVVVPLKATKTGSGK